MVKTISYILVLLLLIAGIYFFVFKKNDSPFSSNEAGFNIKDTAAVGKIFIASNDGETITVERMDDGWRLDGKYRALPSMVELMLNTLAGQAALYPVTKVATDNAVKILSTEGIKVELYNRNNKKICAFYVGGPAVNGNGTNMIMEGSQTPYVVQTPAFTGDLRSRYIPNFKAWRDRTVFNLPASEIKAVSVQYLDKPINSFRITRDNTGYSLTGDPAITAGMGSLNNNRINLYMNYFVNVNCEGYMNGLDGMDTIIQKAVKRTTIDIEKMHGAPEHADIYWMPLNRRSKNRLTADEEVPDEYDADRMYAVINKGADTVLIQALTFKKILRGSFEFYQKDVLHSAQPVERPKNVLIHH